jgi:hypothetical protein
MLARLSSTDQFNTDDAAVSIEVEDHRFAAGRAELKHFAGNRLRVRELEIAGRWIDGDFGAGCFRGFHLTIVARTPPASGPALSPVGLSYLSRLLAQRDSLAGGGGSTRKRRGLLSGVN